MKKAVIISIALIMCFVFTACAPIQAKVADSLEDMIGEEGKSYEEHRAYYQAEWDALGAEFKRLFNIAKDDAEEFIKDKAEEAVDNAIDNVEGAVEDAVDNIEDTLRRNETKVENEINDLKDTYGKKYTGNGQCKGFARKVFCDLFGDNSVVPPTADNNYELVETSNDSIDKVESLLDIQSKSDEEIKEAFADARPGDIVQMRRTHKGPHTAIVVSVTDEGMVWLEANLDGKNGIVTEKYTWAEIRDGKNGYRQNEHLTIYTATDYSLD